MPVTCRSAENRVEGQLADLTNSLFRPETEVAGYRERAVRNVEVRGGPLLIDCQVRGNFIIHEPSVFCLPWRLRLIAELDHS